MFGRKKKTPEEERRRTLGNVGVAGAQTEVVQRYGSAIKEHHVAYSGIDRETSEISKKGLVTISRWKIPEQQDYQKSAVNAQAGYAAEVKTVARENAERIISGRSDRIRRTDDLSEGLRSASGQSVGGVNNQLYDLAAVTQDGSYIEGTARQLKYVGKDPAQCCKNLLSKDFDKYRDANAPIEIPKDFYDAVKAKLDDKIKELELQVKKSGESKALLEQAKKTKKLLRKGKLTKAEAIEARLHPARSTAKDIAGIAHRGGMEAASSAAVLGGGMSFIYHTVSVMKGDETPQKAAWEISRETASSAAMGYASGCFGAAIKGGMENASDAYIRSLSKTSLPSMITVTVVEAGKTLSRYATGQINGTECLNELGEKGSGIVASSIGAAIGQAAIPIPILGGMIGSMFGYALSSMYYEALTQALNEAQMAREERILIEAECEAAIVAIREYRLEMELVLRNYFTSYIYAFDNAFSQMQTAFQTGEVDLLIGGANGITEALGGEILFRTEEEFDELMASSDTILI